MLFNQLSIHQRIMKKYVTLDHKTCHKGKLFEIEIYT